MYVYYCTIGAPHVVTNVMIDFQSVSIDNEINTINFTLSWNEPFANFDPIVNYTVTINCTNVGTCPAIVNTNVTSVGVKNIITDLSVMNLILVTASNSVGTSDPTARAIVGRHPTLCTCICTYVHSYMYVRTYTFTYRITYK